MTPRERKYKYSRNTGNELKKLLDAFKHMGWVNGLTTDQYIALDRAQEYLNNLLCGKNDAIKAKRLRKKGLTFREIASIMGYSHPGSISHLLSKKPPRRVPAKHGS